MHIMSGQSEKGLHSPSHPLGTERVAFITPQIDIELDP